MDLSKQILDKIGMFNDTPYAAEIKAVVDHIEISESHLRVGRDSDDRFFNDVVYRTNQAFEGSLKVAFRVFVGDTASKQSPYAIENFFETNDVLRPRVLEQFRNYRREWRNPSTHEHTLTFSGQEAFLAIVSISAFFTILLDQMIEKITYVDTYSHARLHRPTLPINYRELSLLDQVSSILKCGAMQFKGDRYLDYATERETLVGKQIEGYLNVADPSILVQEFPRLVAPNGDEFRPDLLLRRGDEVIVVEIKVRRALPLNSQVPLGIKQLVEVSSATNVRAGILFIAPSSFDKNMTIRREESQAGDHILELVLLIPSAG